MFLLWALVAAVALVVAVAPLLVRSSVRFSTNATVIQLGPDDIPPAVLGDLQVGSLQWVDRGFELVADLFVDGFVTNVKTYRRLLVDADRTTVALVGIEVDARRPEVREMVMGLGSRAQRLAGPDGYDWDEVSTTDVAQPLPPLPAGTVSTAVPGATADQLLALHRRALATVGDRPLLPLGYPVQAARQDLDRAVGALREVGAIEPTGEPGEWRLTVAGAYRLTIPNLPGFLHLGRARRRRRAAALIRAEGQPG